MHEPCCNDPQLYKTNKEVIQMLDDTMGPDNNAFRERQHKAFRERQHPRPYDLKNAILGQAL